MCAVELFKNDNLCVYADLDELRADLHINNRGTYFIMECSAYKEAGIMWWTWLFSLIKCLKKKDNALLFTSALSHNKPVKFPVEGNLKKIYFYLFILLHKGHQSSQTNRNGNLSYPNQCNKTNRRAEHLYKPTCFWEGGWLETWPGRTFKTNHNSCEYDSLLVAIINY